MNLPTQTQDVWTLATDGDKLKALALLGDLPSRQTSSAELQQATFFVALEGVTRYGLNEAVKAILQNALGHAFFPSPPELRGQVDKAMKWHEDELRRIRHQERIAAERIPPRVEPTPEQKARVAKAHQEFHASLDAGKAADREAQILAERAAIRERYGMTEETLASVKDNPLAKARMGKSA